MWVNIYKLKLGPLIVHNFDDQSPIKITRKDVEEKTKMNVNALTISSDFNLSFPPEEVLIHGLYVYITRDRG